MGPFKIAAKRQVRVLLYAFLFAVLFIGVSHWLASVDGCAVLSKYGHRCLVPF
jgi:hypothetical protein